MGQILSQPVTEKHSESDASKHLAYGLSLMQGWRINMEDAHATILDFSDSGSSGNSTEKSATSTILSEAPKRLLRRTTLVLLNKVFLLATKIFSVMRI